MAAKTFTDFKDSFRLEYGRLPTLEEAWKAAKREEALKPSHNTGSPKLPCFTDWSVFAASQGISPAQAHEVHAWFARQLRASA